MAPLLILLYIPSTNTVLSFMLWSTLSQYCIKSTISHWTIESGFLSSVVAKVIGKGSSYARLRQLRSRFCTSLYESGYIFDDTLPIFENCHQSVHILSKKKKRKKERIISKKNLTFINNELCITIWICTLPSPRVSTEVIHS